MDKIALSYAGYLGRIDANLDVRGFAGQSQDLEWDWYTAFVAGTPPSYAVDDALRAHPLTDSQCSGFGCVDTCADCDVRGCDDCGIGHTIQKCPAIRKELFA